MTRKYLMLFLWVLWDLIEKIQHNIEDWEIDKGKGPGINYEYDCVVSWITDTGSKGYPLFRFGMGREGGWEMSSAEGTSSQLKIYVQACTTETQGVYPGSGRPEANSPTPACLDRVVYHGVALQRWLRVRTREVSARG